MHDDPDDPVIHPNEWYGRGSDADPYKSERRERTVRNARKMGVSGRSAFLLLNLARQQAARRNTRRLRKGK